MTELERDMFNAAYLVEYSHARETGLEPKEAGRQAFLNAMAAINKVPINDGEGNYVWS